MVVVSRRSASPAPPSSRSNLPTRYLIESRGGWCWLRCWLPRAVPCWAVPRCFASQLACAFEFGLAYSTAALLRVGCFAGELEEFGERVGCPVGESVIVRVGCPAFEVWKFRCVSGSLKLVSGPAAPSAPPHRTPPLPLPVPAPTAPCLSLGFGPHRLLLPAPACSAPASRCSCVPPETPLFSLGLLCAFLPLYPLLSGLPATAAAYGPARAKRAKCRAAGERVLPQVQAVVPCLLCAALHSMHCLLACLPCTSAAAVCCCV